MTAETRQTFLGKGESSLIFINIAAWKIWLVTGRVSNNKNKQTEYLDVTVTLHWTVAKLTETEHSWKQSTTGNEFS